MLQQFLLACFILSALAIVMAPKRIAIAAWLFSTHFDLGGDVLTIGGGLAGVNAIKAVVFPTILFLRLGARHTVGSSLARAPCLLWVVFSVFACASIFWTGAPYLTGAIKQSGYLYAFVVGLFALAHGWRAGLIGPNMVLFYLGTGLVMAVLQTYVFDNAFGTTAQFSRFVSFISKNAYAEFLAGVMCFALFLPGIRGPTRFAAVAVILVAAVLNGGRAGFLCCVLVLGLHFAFLLGRGRVASVLVVIAMLVLGLGVLQLTAFERFKLEDNRLFELYEGVQSQDVEAVGTLSLRLNFWGATLERIMGFPAHRLIVGRGLSAAGELRREEAGRRDPNRTVHNEFIRIAYEMGLFGFCLFFAFWLSLVVALALVKGADRYLLCSAAAAFGVFCLMENMLSGAANAGGVVFLLLFAYVLATTMQPSAVAADSHARHTRHHTRQGATKPA